MKVPEPVRAVFNRFPLYEFPAPPASVPELPDTWRLAVYSVDSENFPLDPRCLGLYCLLVLLGKTPEIVTESPYITAAQTLPVAWFSGDQTAKRGIKSVQELLQTLNHNVDPRTKVFMSLIETWLDDAWHETIMDPQNVSIRDAIYVNPAEKTFPWPFSRIVQRQLDEHLDTRQSTVKQGLGDDYICSPANLSRAGMALQALSKVVTAPLTSRPEIIDVLVFAYTWPILSALGGTTLAELVPPMLHQHAQEVRSFFLSASM